MKPSTTKEPTTIMHKSITFKTEKTTKHLNQEHLYFAIIDNNPKLNVTRTFVINGTQLRCYIHQSIYHIAQQCSEKCVTYYTQEVVLYQSDFDDPDKVKNPMSETWNAAVLDSGNTNTTAGNICFKCYINSLKSEEKLKIQHHVEANIYRLCDGNLVEAVEKVDLPVAIGSKHVMFNRHSAK